MTKKGSIDGYRMDCNGVGVLRGQRHIPRKIDPSTPIPGNLIEQDSWRQGLYTLYVKTSKLGSEADCS